MYLNAIDIKKYVRQAILQVWLIRFVYLIRVLIEFQVQLLSDKRSSLYKLDCHFCGKYRPKIEP